jgi:hypothetical protein
MSGPSRLWLSLIDTISQTSASWRKISADWKCPDYYGLFKRRGIICMLASDDPSCLSINRPTEYLSSVHFLAWEKSEFQSPGRSGISISNRIKQSKTALLLRATARMMRVVHCSGDGVRLPLFHPMRISRPCTWLNSAPNSKSEVPKSSIRVGF